MNTLRKYPRTHHLEGSRLQPGDEDLDCVPFASIAGRFIVVEEKLDGANSAISFNARGEMLLQSRGHFLDGGPRERQFDLFKTWANAHRRALWQALGARFVVYGEWLYAKHTIFYDALPHYFLEFDILDTEKGEFLSTDRRRALLVELPVLPVPVISSGKAESLKRLAALIGPSVYKTARWRERLEEVSAARQLDIDQVRKQTDHSDLMEGLYIKVEEAGRVVARLKYIRASFLQAVFDSGSHWQDRPLVPNLLRPGVEIVGLFGAQP